VLDTEFIYEQAPFPECHASTIAETSRGLVTAWFGGKEERSPDVCIYVSRKDKGASRWTEPVNVANGIQNDSFRYPCWNPVLYQVPSGELLLFYKVGANPVLWKGWLIRSKDGGVSWSAPEALPENYLGPIKNKPVGLKDGTLLCPSSTESKRWEVHFEMTKDGGKTWSMAGPDTTAGYGKDEAGKIYEVIQPSVLFYPGGRLQALCRSKNRAILDTWSEDGGKSWSALKPIPLPNNNSGLDAVTLKDGRQLLVYNHVLPSAGKTNGSRGLLNVAVSRDGQTWFGSLVLENSQPDEFSYPGVIQTSDGMVHIVYTWKRKRVKHVVVDPAKLEMVRIEKGVWPSTITK
jgi:alpha-L-rhamnosidase